VAGIKHGYAVVFELDIERLTAISPRDNRFQKLPDLPSVDVDINLICSDSVAWTAIARTVAAASALISDVQFVDQYRGTGIPPGHPIGPSRRSRGSA
jgi:phenylalanyl-tRNA synthetase beta chain